MALTGARGLIALITVHPRNPIETFFIAHCLLFVYLCRYCAGIRQTGRELDTHEALDGWQHEGLQDVFEGETELRRLWRKRQWPKYL